ncbi:hypothetical protein O3M35_000927 [Rhynocoris fuscipes]|uniref:Uncharacterized protein n=1 Tax=Rhynocoris fuscipes TaxID=488301 RepID=A0AAW1DNH5_9HEMI
MQRVLQRFLPTCESITGMRMRISLQDSLSNNYGTIVQPTQALKELEDFRPLDTDCERILILPNILLTDDCKKPPKTKESECKHPDLRPKEVPLFQYGRCKDKEHPMPMACPPKGDHEPVTCDPQQKRSKSGRGGRPNCKK